MLASHNKDKALVRTLLALTAAVAIAGCSGEKRAANDTMAYEGNATAAAPRPTPTPTPSPVASTDPAINRLTARIAKDGAKPVLARVSEEDPDWSHFLDKLAKGDPAALSLAAQLRPAADAGAAEALDTATGQALPHAPLPVLALAKTGAPVATLCTSPFIEPEAGVEKRYNKAALAALDAIPSAQRPEPTFTQCRDALAKIGKEL